MDGDGEQTIGELLGRCLRAVGAGRVFGSSASGITGIPGVGHVRVDEPILAALLGDAQGRLGPGPGATLLPGRRLRLSASPGTEVVPVVVDDVALLPEAVATWGVGAVFGCAELVLDVDLDAPAPAGAEPVAVGPAGPALTLSPTLAEFRTLILAGPGVVRAGVVDDLATFAARTGLGVVNTWGAKGVFRWDSPHHYGTAGLQARDFELAGFGEAELVIAVGVDPDEAPRSAWAHGQVLEVEPWQLAGLADRWPAPGPVPPYPALYQELATALAPVYADEGSPLTPARAARDLADVRPAGGVVAADPGPAGLWVARTFPTTEPGSVVVPARRADGVAVATAMVCALDHRPALAVTTSPFDPVTEALVELAGAVGSRFVLCEWGADVVWADAHAHPVALRTALDAPGVAHVPVPIDFDRTRALVEVAGPIVAWPEGWA